MERTQTRRKQHNIQVGEELLLVRVEVAQSGDDVTRQTNADYFQYCSKNEHDEMIE